MMLESFCVCWQDLVHLVFINFQIQTTLIRRKVNFGSSSILDSVSENVTNLFLALLTQNKFKFQTPNSKTQETRNRITPTQKDMAVRDILGTPIVDTAEFGVVDTERVEDVGAANAEVMVATVSKDIGEEDAKVMDMAAKVVTAEDMVAKVTGEEAARVMDTAAKVVTAADMGAKDIGEEVVRAAKVDIVAMVITTKGHKLTLIDLAWNNVYE